MDTLIVTKRSQLTDIADAIRAKTGKSDEITLNDMPVEISEIGGGRASAMTVSITAEGSTTTIEVPMNISVAVSVAAEDYVK